MSWRDDWEKMMDTLVYAANFLYLASYLVRDILHLRMLTVVAACCLVTYFYSQPQPLMTVVYWNLFFVVLNVFQLVHIVRNRLRTDDESRGDVCDTATQAM